MSDRHEDSYSRGGSGSRNRTVSDSDRNRDRDRDRSSSHHRRNGDNRHSHQQYNEGAGPSSVRERSSSSYDRSRQSSQRGRNGNSHGNGRGEKRGRDRSNDSRSSCQSSSKVPKRSESFRGRGGRGGRGGQNGARGKKREEFVNQQVTIPVDLVKKGKLGPADKVVNLTANFFPVESNSERKFSLFLYHIDFTPSSEIRGIRNSLLYQHKEEFGRYVYNGDSQLFMLNKFPSDNVTFDSQDREKNNYQIRLRFAREVLYTEGNYLSVLNLIVRNAMRGLNLQLVKRDFFDAAAAIEMEQHRLQIWPGYMTSIRQHEQRILLCCKISHKVMRNESVLDIIRDCMRGGGDYRSEASRKIVGSTVLTSYNNTTYRVDSIDWDSNPRTEFETKNGPETFISYYERRYQLRISDDGQPLLFVKASAKNIRGGNDRPILLIPELCKATGITDNMRRDFRLMRDMSDKTRMTPQEMVRDLMKFNGRLQNTPDSMNVFRENNLRLGGNLVRFDGKHLEQQVIQFGGDFRVDLGSGSNKADWTRNLQSCKMFKSKNWTNWYFVYPSKDKNDALGFLRTLRRIVENFRLTFTEPQHRPVNDSIICYSQKLEEIIAEDPQFIMVAVSSNAADRYGAIKKTALCCANPVPVQVVSLKTMKSNKIMSIATKIAIQVNCKLGGIPWTVDLKLKDIMIVGFDVSHDSNSKSQSYGAMVASLNPNNNGGDYFSAVNRHENGEQLSSHFGTNILKALTKYFEVNGSYPKRILIYRDGVGDGQIEYVVNQELIDIKTKVRRVYQERGIDEEPKLGFVIVNKRTNARIMTCGGRNGYDNPQPGTVADDAITMPERYDFYLVSQLVTQGTVCPTYYNVIEDGFYAGRPDIMQTMTFKLCHLYFNWSGTTRIPSVVQYAKKLAFLVGQFMHQEPSNNIKRENQLYFL